MHQTTCWVSCLPRPPSSSRSPCTRILLIVLALLMNEHLQAAMVEHCCGYGIGNKHAWLATIGSMPNWQQ